MNKGKKIKVQKIPYCSCIDLHAIILKERKNKYVEQRHKILRYLDTTLY